MLGEVPKVVRGGGVGLRVGSWEKLLPWHISFHTRCDLVSLTLAVNAQLTSVVHLLQLSWWDFLKTPVGEARGDE